MPFQVRNVCYPDATTALQAWKSDFPSAPDGTGVVWYVNAVAINATTGVITGTLKKSTAITTTNITGITLPACNPDAAASVFDKMPLNDLVFSAVLIFVFISGFGQGRAK